MFRVVADTSTKDLFIALIEKEKCIDYILKRDLLKKTDVFPVLFEELLAKNNMKIKDINAFYCTNGPGSFTGARTAFIFFKIICMINNKDLYLTNSLKFLAKAKANEVVVIDARSEMQYFAKVNNKHMEGSISLKVSKQALSVFDEKDFLNNTKDYMDSFAKTNNLLQSSVNYIKEPSIGQVKK